MNKSELIAAMAEKTGLSQKEAKSGLEAFITTVKETLQSGEKVTLVDFGIFESRERAARVGTNPRTKEPIEIPASKSPAFKAGKAFKEFIK